MFQVTYHKLSDNARLTLFPTLLFLVFVLWDPSRLFCQEYEYEFDVSQYPQAVDGAVIPLKPGQAILSWRVEPRGDFSNVVSASIIPSVTYPHEG